MNAFMEAIGELITDIVSIPFEIIKWMTGSGGK